MSFKLNFIKSIYLVILSSFTLFELLNGYFSKGFLFTNIYILFLFTVVVGSYKGRVIDSFMLLHILLLFFLALFLDIRSSYIMSSSFIFRSVFFAYIIFLIFSNFTDSESIDLARKIIFLTWGIITFAILLSFTFKIGYYTYPNFEVGRKFFFPSQNELSTSYFIISFSFFFNIRSKLRKGIVFVLSLCCFSIIGTKIFILFMFFSFYFLFFRCFSFRFLLFLSVFALCFLSAVSFYILPLILDLILNFSSASNLIVQKVQSVGIFSSLVGQRDFLMSLAFSYIDKSFYAFNYVFGKGVGSFSHEYAVFRGLPSGISYSENDLLDIFMSFGFLGVGLIGLFWFNIIKKIKKFSGNLDNRYIDIVVFLFLIASITSGHILTSSFPIFSFLVCLISRVGYEYTHNQSD